MSTVSMTDLSDVFLVGGAGHGADFLQNIYGMYVAKEQMYSGDASNIGVAVDAYKFSYKPVISTSLMYTPEKDVYSSEYVMGVVTSHRFMIRREWKDALVQVWKTFSPESTWEEFRDGESGFEMVTNFENAVSQMSFTKTISYESLVSEPQTELCEFIYDILPQQDNDQLDFFGVKQRVLSLNIIDHVVQESLIRDLRKGSQSGLLESVGIHNEFLTEEQISEIDEFVASL
jgi:hypothetical protein